MVVSREGHVVPAVVFKCILSPFTFTFFFLLPTPPVANDAVDVDDDDAPPPPRAFNRVRFVTRIIDADDVIADTRVRGLLRAPESRVLFFKFFGT